MTVLNDGLENQFSVMDTGLLNDEQDDVVEDRESDETKGRKNGASNISARRKIEELIEIRRLQAELHGCFGEQQDS